MFGIEAGIGVSSSSGASNTLGGDFTVTGGGGGGGLLDFLGAPKTPTNQSWIVYAFGAVIAGLGLLYFLKQ